MKGLDLSGQNECNNIAFKMNFSKMRVFIVAVLTQLKLADLW